MLNGVLKALWHTQGQVKKENDQLKGKLDREAQALVKVNEGERAKLEGKENLSPTEAQAKEIKELNHTLLEEKAQHIKYEELLLAELKKRVLDDFSALPPDLKESEKKLFELKYLVMNMQKALPQEK